MPIHLNRIRLTLVWTQSFPLDVLPNSILGTYAVYVAQFAKAQDGGSLRLPWQKDKEQHFWENYLNVKKGTLSRITQDKAWRNLVPLRISRPVMVDQTSHRSDTKIGFEGLIYPHGVAAIATIYVTEDLALAAMVNKLVRLRTGEHTATWLTTQETQSATLDKIAERLLDELYAMALGPTVERKEAGAPITLATPIDGTGVNIAKPNSPDGAVHRALEGLCVLNKYWQKKQLHDWNTATTHQFKEKDYVAASHAVYALKRNYTIWFPGNFTEYIQEDERLLPKNGCYHRNLTFASAQIESLLNLMEETARWLEQPGVTLSSDTKDIIEHAVDILGRHYGGVKEAYMSWSVQQQIESKRAVVDKVRIASGRQALFKPDST